jgi:hypothetical protein
VAYRAVPLRLGGLPPRLEVDGDARLPAGVKDGRGLLPK